MSIDETLQQTFRLAIPEATLVGVACVLYLLATCKVVSRQLAGVVALAGLGAALILDRTLTFPTEMIPTVAPFLPSNLATAVRWIMCISSALLILFAWSETSGHRAAEYYGSLLIATAGVSLTASANDLIALFLALEMLSIPTYVLLFLHGKDVGRTNETMIKYFMLSIFSSGLALFGLSYLYGICGSTNIAVLNSVAPVAVLAEHHTTGLIALVFMLAGIGFRITAFPFHFYAPDVYQAGPSVTVAFLAFVPKVAGFVALIKLTSFAAISGTQVGPEFLRKALLVLWVLAVVTMFAGNFMALLQNNLRRLLAYSSVANAGYMLIGLATMPTLANQPTTSSTIPFILQTSGHEALLVYLVAYGLMTIGAFAILAYLNHSERPVHTIEDLAGLAKTNPLPAALLAVCVVSMIGLPLTAGFVGKVLLFANALNTSATVPMHDMLSVLAIIGAINAAIAAGYYLKVLVAMYLRTAIEPVRTSGARHLLVVGGICASLTVFFGLYPKPLFQFAHWAFGM
ncbi:MAG: NADH-quinone oxidoreductase subunit N [Zavarzinella sp.]